MVLGYAWNPLLALAVAAAGYVLGNFQTAILISKRAFHDDVREHGSGNAGTTNMIRVFGMKPGIVTFIGDCAKAIAGVLLGRLIMGTLGGYIAGLFVIVGHCWPVFAGFRGGKGVASSLRMDDISARCCDHDRSGGDHVFVQQKDLALFAYRYGGILRFCTDLSILGLGACAACGHDCAACICAA